MISVLIEEGNLLRDRDTQREDDVKTHRRKQSSSSQKRPAAASSQLVSTRMRSLPVVVLTYSFYLSFPRVLCRIRNYLNSKAVSYISVQNQRLTNPKARKAQEEAIMP